MLALAAFAERAHLRRQRQRVADQAQREIGDAEGGRQREHEEEQGDLDPPGRVDEEDVALADAAGERECHRRGEHRDQPDKPPHQLRRSRRDLKPRTASRLSTIDGGSKLIEVEESCLNCASAFCEPLVPASK